MAVGCTARARPAASTWLVGSPTTRWAATRPRACGPAAVPQQPLLLAAADTAGASGRLPPRCAWAVAARHGQPEPASSVHHRLRPGGLRPAVATACGVRCWRGAGHSTTPLARGLGRQAPAPGPGCRARARARRGTVAAAEGWTPRATASPHARACPQARAWRAVPRPWACSPGPAAAGSWCASCLLAAEAVGWRAPAAARSAGGTGSVPPRRAYRCPTLRVGRGSSHGAAGTARATCRAAGSAWHADRRPGVAAEGRRLRRLRMRGRTPVLGAPPVAAPHGAGTVRVAAVRWRQACDAAVRAEASTAPRLPGRSPRRLAVADGPAQVPAPGMAGCYCQRHPGATPRAGTWLWLPAHSVVAAPPRGACPAALAAGPG